ncbi:MAG: 16S rRNA (guanine(527)-N(7))-methyltransferase RsmG [Amaricoccus sp.]|nr:16S rRNA (guanine(527)-N(7))-methyltransferase RsmG [Amaricoccus sp.]
MGPVTDAKGFADAFGVSRETSERLQALHDLVLKWNPRINLISRADTPDLWRRHIADSAQLWALASRHARRWADLGAGAGFPGLVIAALAAEQNPDLRVTLVESDGRKAVFLAEAARRMDLAIDLRDARAEALPPLAADVISARAFASLDALLAHVEKHRRPAGIGLFPKGRGVHKEIEAAGARWRFDHRLHSSATDPEAAIVEVGALSRV